MLGVVGKFFSKAQNLRQRCPKGLDELGIDCLP